MNIGLRIALTGLVFLVATIILIIALFAGEDSELDASLAGTPIRRTLFVGLIGEASTVIIGLLIWIWTHQ